MSGSRVTQRRAVFHVSTAEQMRSLGAVFGEHAPDHAVLLLSGELGVGKTTFAQGVGAGCGVVEAVASPTYNVILEYQGRRPFTHVDLYRLSESHDLATIDVDGLLDAPGVVCVEWPARIESLVTQPWAKIEIVRRGEGGERVTECRWMGPGWEPLAEELNAWR